jgi:hypothetical protein
MGWGALSFLGFGLGLVDFEEGGDWQAHLDVDLTEHVGGVVRIRLREQRMEFQAGLADLRRVSTALPMVSPSCASSKSTLRVKVKEVWAITLL